MREIDEDVLGSFVVVFGVLAVIGLVTLAKLVSTRPQQQIYAVEFEGHSYVVYRQGNRGGICHSESCSCKEAK